MRNKSIKLLLLSLIMILLSNVSFVEAEAETFPKYQLQASDGVVQNFDNAGALINAINEIHDGKSYTLTLNNDLELNKGLELKNNFIIQGKNEKTKITLADDFRYEKMISVTRVSKEKQANITLKNLSFEGKGKEAQEVKLFTYDNTKQYSYYDQYDPMELNIENCNFKDYNGRLLYLRNLKVRLENCNFENLKYEKRSSFQYESGNIIEIGNYYDGCTTEIIDCNFSNNYCESSVLEFVGKEIDIKNCNFYSNEYMSNVLSIRGDNVVNINNTHFDKCILIREDFYQTTPMYLGGSNEINIENCSVNNCKGGVAGAIIVDNNTNVNIKNSNFKNNTAIENGAILYETGNFYSSKNIKVEGCEFINNSGRSSGALNFKPSPPPPPRKSRPINTTLLNTNSYSLMQEPPASSYIGTLIKDSNFDNNKSNIAGAVNIFGPYDVKVRNSKFNNNQADEDLHFNLGGSGSGQNIGQGLLQNGGAIRCINAKLTVDDSSFVNNYSSRLGGAIYYENNERNNSGGNPPPPKMFESPIEADNSENSEEKNKAPYDIYTDPQKLDDLYKDLTVGEDVLFKSNRAGYGYYNPPKNFEKFTNLKFKQSSLEGKLVIQNEDKTWKNVRSILNNFDVNYLNPVTTTTYDANNKKDIYVAEALLTNKFTKEIMGGDEQYPYLRDCIVDYRNTKILKYDETKLPQDMQVAPAWYDEADGSGHKYEYEEPVTLKGNLYVFAKPEPKEPERIFIPYIPVLNKEDHYQYLIGYKDDTFRPENNMTREEVAVMFSRLLKNPPTKGKIYNYNFTDVERDRWSITAISYMSEMGIIKGYPDGTFRPQASITRAEFASIAAKFAELKEGNKTFSDLNRNHWAYEIVSRAVTAGWINGYPDGTFKPDNKITRAEVVSITNLMLNRKADEKYVDNNLDKLLKYKDVTKNHWAYYKIFEATNGHDFVRQSNKIDEEWKDVTNKSFVYDK